MFPDVPRLLCRHMKFLAICNAFVVDPDPHSILVHPTKFIHLLHQHSPLHVRCIPDVGLNCHFITQHTKHSAKH